MVNATPDLGLPSQPSGITAPLPVPNILLDNKGTCVNDLPMVAAVA